MPTYLRWRITLLGKKVYFYIATAICVIICVYMISQSVSAYESYKEGYTAYEILTQNSDYRTVEVQYNALQEKGRKLLQQRLAMNTQLVTINLLDGAMVNSQSIGLKQITFTDDGFSVDGVASTEEAYQEYINYVRAHLQGWNCNGKQEVERDSQHQLFHLDGYKKKSANSGSMGS